MVFNMTEQNNWHKKYHTRLNRFDFSDNESPDKDTDDEMDTFSLTLVIASTIAKRV